MLGRAPVWQLHAATYDIFFVATVSYVTAAASSTDRAAPEAVPRLKVRVLVVQEHDEGSPRTFEVLDGLLARVARSEFRCVQPPLWPAASLSVQPLFLQSVWHCNQNSRPARA